jgi:hypothetical protein
MKCVNGTCACLPHYADCDQDPINGCEADLLTDPENCGLCGDLCPPNNPCGPCTQGICPIIDCTPGFANCDGNCANGCEVNILTDPMNCGQCGLACPAGQVCIQGACP